MKTLVEAGAPSLAGSLAFTIIQQGSPELERILNLLAAHWRRIFFLNQARLSCSKNEHPKMNLLTQTISPS